MDDVSAVEHTVLMLIRLNKNMVITKWLDNVRRLLRNAAISMVAIAMKMIMHKTSKNRSQNVKKRSMIVLSQIYNYKNLKSPDHRVQKKILYFGRHIKI